MSSDSSSTGYVPSPNLKSTQHRKYTPPHSFSAQSFSPQTTTNELLTIFQSSPLAWEYEKGKFKPVGMLDLKTEQRELRQVLKNTKVEVDLAFDFCTTDRLSNFLIQGKGHILHYSGHGHPDYLAIEEKYTGKLHQLAVKDLQRWIKTGGESLQLVFVSACHSRAAGDAFIAAGVKHVVCCQRDDQMIRNDAAIEFEAAFYEALANGNTIAQAFECGNNKVRTSHRMDRDIAHEEVKKFVLLPLEGDHDVKIFDPESPSYPRTISEEESMLMYGRPAGIFPLPPDDFEGRQVEMHRVLAALQTTRVVRVTGPMNIGKCSIVKGVCQYIQKRQHIFDDTISDRYWLDFDEEDGLVDYSLLLDGDTYTDGISFASKREQVIYSLNERQSLLVIDGRSYSPAVFEEVKCFLDDVIEFTEDTRAILIERFEQPSLLKRFRGNEREIHIGPLSFRSTLTLFGKLCPHVQEGIAEVGNVKGLRNLVLSESSSCDELTTKIGRDFYQMVGEGIPELVQQTAKSMTLEDYTKLLILGKGLKRVQEWKAELQCHTRVGLDSEILEIQQKIDDAVGKEDYTQAEGFDTFLQEMLELQEHLPTKLMLERKASSLESRLKQAQSMSYQEAGRLSRELHDIQERLRQEEEAMRNLKRLKHEKTRFGMEIRLASLLEEYEEADEQHQWGRLREISARIHLIRQSIASKPSMEELETVISKQFIALKEAREKAKESQEENDIEVVEEIHKILLQSHGILAAEKEAEIYPNNPWGGVVGGEDVPEDIVGHEAAMWISSPSRFGALFTVSSSIPALIEHIQDSETKPATDEQSESQQSTNHVVVGTGVKNIKRSSGAHGQSLAHLENDDKDRKGDLGNSRDALLDSLPEKVKPKVKAMIIPNILVESNTAATKIKLGQGLIQAADEGDHLGVARNRECRNDDKSSSTHLTELGFEGNFCLNQPVQSPHRLSHAAVEDPPRRRARGTSFGGEMCWRQALAAMCLSSDRRRKADIKDSTHTKRPASVAIETKISAAED